MLLFIFLTIYLYFLIRAVIAQTLIPIAELVIPIEIPSKDAKAEIEIHPVTLEWYNLFCASYSSVHFVQFISLTK